MGRWGRHGKTMIKKYRSDHPIPPRRQITSANIESRPQSRVIKVVLVGQQGSQRFIEEKTIFN